MLSTLMQSHYKSGDPLTDIQVANLMIALLMAGQHTSSATLSWLWARLVQHPEWQYVPACARTGAGAGGVLRTTLMVVVAVVAAVGDQEPTRRGAAGGPRRGSAPARR